MSGLTWQRMFASEAGPYAEVQWEKRDALIKYADGKVVFCQKDVLVPSTWSQLATNVVAQKYLRGFLDKEGNPGPNRETSVRQLIDRVVDTIAGWAGYVVGTEDTVPEGWTTESFNDNGSVKTVAYKRPKRTMQPTTEVYFADKTSWEAWRDDLKWLCVHQHFAFNSPVWFNVGLDEHPQCSACFIVKMEDHMSGEQDEEFNLNSHGLLAAQVKEGIIFSKGSGSGINLSRVRSSKEWLSSGGRPTGPLSFARGLDTWASQIKSGGKTRRAAKMLILDVDHPDVLEFIRVKSEEEKVAKTLIANGYPGNMDGEAYQHAFHQNSNLSVRLSDEFMQAVSEGKDWHLISRSFHNLESQETATSMIGRMGAVLETHKAKDIMRHIAQSCWESGDPGVHFSGQINHWHTCADEEPIVASNPCSEYLFLDETACNLASLNLRRFLHKTPSVSPFKAREFIAAVRIATIAMEAIVSNSRYPTANFSRMSHRYRTIGLGYANLGGMLMDLGIPYDSDFGRNIAAVITSLMCSQSYLMSAQIANELGAFGGYEANKQSVLKVMQQHHEASEQLAHVDFPKGDGWDLWADEATRSWASVITACRAGRGIRNAQATVLAPTGTIAFLMDCETTGIEPELGLVKYKVLSGGGTLQIINPLVEMFLTRAGLSEDKVREVAKHLMDGKSIRTAEAIAELRYPEQLSEVFRTSFPPAMEDKNFSLGWKAHIEMMAAVQPFISGAISKTVNMPESSTVEDVTKAFEYAWQAGLKCVAIYRDNSKAVQAIATTQKDDGSVKGETKVVERVVIKTIDKRSLPPTVPTTRHKFSIDGHKGYLHVGYYPDTWKVAEIFVKLSKTGSTLNGFVDAACKLWSTALQYGAPLSEIAGGFLEHEFEPRGFVEYDPHVRSCRSVLDYIAKKVIALEAESVAIKGLPIHATQPSKDDGYTHTEGEPEFIDVPDPEPIKVGLTCRNCGRANVAVKGKCKVCLTCGSEEGGCYA